MTDPYTTPISKQSTTMFRSNPMKNLKLESSDEEEDDVDVCLDVLRDEIIAMRHESNPLDMGSNESVVAIQAAILENRRQMYEHFTREIVWDNEPSSKKHKLQLFEEDVNVHVLEQRLMQARASVSKLENELMEAKTNRKKTVNSVEAHKTRVFEDFMKGEKF